VPAPVIKIRARELRGLGERKAREFRRSQLGRVLRVLTLRSTEDSSETTPAISSNYVQLQLCQKVAANEWIDALITEREDKIVGDIENFAIAGTV
jgi:tRNA A37 methylthiotransferase MiaB